MAQKLTQEEFIKRSILIHDDKYDYSLTNYIGSNNKVKIICKEHGIFEQKANDHIHGRGCKKCHVNAQTKSNEQFLKDVIAKHGDRYDYSLVDYKNTNTKVDIICFKHGIFSQIPKSHIKGYGCCKCGYKQMIKMQRKSTKTFINDARNIHGNRYDYSAVEYINKVSKVKIRCYEHGIFEQEANSHLKGSGCNDCVNTQLSLAYQKTKEQFVIDANKIHDNKYDYSASEYINAHIKVKIICPTHGIFKQVPNGHLSQKQGCPKCTNGISKPEMAWLDYIGVSKDDKHRQVRLTMYNNKKRNVDGFDPITNTVYEFHGDYWHGNPNTTDHTKINPTNKKSFRQLYEDTLVKEKLIKDSGYFLVTIWESDWKKIAL